MKLTSSECVTGFNKAPYCIRTAGVGAKMKIFLDWVNKKTGVEESVEVFNNEAEQDMGVVLASVRKAITCE